MAVPMQGNDGPSGGPNEDRKDRKPFAVEQAERDLKDARDRLKAAKQGSADRKAAEEQVKKAERQLEKLTKGSREARRKASREYMEKYFDNLGGDWVQELYESNPELRDLVEKAIRKGWTSSQEGMQNFLDEFYQTDFYKDPKRGLAWFDSFRLERGDERAQKEFADKKRGLHDSIRAAAAKYGIQVSDEQLDSIARQSLYGGWNETDLDSWMARRFRKQSGQYEDPEYTVGGTVGENRTLLKNLARDMGLTFDEKWFTQNAAKLTEVRQNFTITDVQNLLLDAAREQYGLTENDLGFTEAGGGFRSLRALVSQAIAAGGDTARRLLEDSRIQGLLTGWESADGRSLAEIWNESLASAKVVLRGEARRLGLNLDEATLDQLSREFQYRNWDDNPSAMRQYLAGLVEEPGGPGEPGDGEPGGDTGGGDDVTPGEPTDPGTPVWSEGEQASLERQLRSWARNYGVDLGDEWFKSWINKIILDPEGGWTQDDALNEIIKFSRQTYGVFSEEINDGMTVRDLAGGYIQRMARLLEIDASEVDLNDPIMQKALTGRTEDGKANLMSLYDFGTLVRQDDRWQSTDNALNSYSSVANDILKKMGFVA
jgi:hypothetical protein